MRFFGDKTKSVGSQFKIKCNSVAVLKKLTIVHAKYAKESQKTQRIDSAHFALIIFVAFARTLFFKLLIK